MAGIDRKDITILGPEDIEGKPAALTETKGKAGRKPKKAFQELRRMAQRIADEAAMRDGELVVIDGRTMTNQELVLREMMTSRRGQDRKDFIEIAYGKVPNETHIEADHKVTFEVVHTDDWEDDPLDEEEDA